MVAISGYGSEATRQTAFDAGFDYYLDEACRHRQSARDFGKIAANERWLSTQELERSSGIVNLNQIVFL